MTQKLNVSGMEHVESNKRASTQLSFVQSSAAGIDLDHQSSKAMVPLNTLTASFNNKALQKAVDETRNEHESGEYLWS